MRMRTGHSKRIISVFIALSIVLSMMSGLSLSVSAAEAVSVSSWSQLKAALESTADVNITVTDNIDFTASDATTATSNCISITSGVKTLDLNGKGVSFMVDTFELMEVSNVPKSVISISGSASLSIKDSVGKGILEYIAYGSEYFAFTSPKQSGGLISMSGSSKLNVTNAILNNVAVGPCVNVTSGSPTVNLSGATLTTGSSLYSWSGGFALFVNAATTSPSVTLSNGSKLLCSSVNAVYSAYSNGGGAMYIGNYNASVNITSATLLGTVQSRVSGSTATKLPYMSVATHSIKVDKTVHTADADYLLGPSNYDVSADASGSGSGYYFMVIADANGNSQTITTEIVSLSEAVEEEKTFDTVVGAFEGAYGATELGYKYNFSSDEAGTNLVNATTYFADKITPAVGGDTSSISVTSDIAAKMEGFAQFYSDNRWTCNSELSFDLKMGSESNDFAGFYVKYGDEIVSGTSKNAVFFANDGVRGDSLNSTTGTTGIGFSFRTINNVACIEIFVKYLDSNGKLCVNGQYFYNVVDNLSEFNTYRVTDEAGTVKFYANDVLFAVVVCSDAKVPTANTSYTEKYYSNAQIMNSKGEVLATVSNALVSTESAIAFATRNETLEIDNFEAKDKTVADPKINARSLTLTNDITVRYIVIKANLDSAGYTNPVIKATFGSQEYVLESKIETVSNISCYVFDFENVVPQMMGDTIHTVLYAELNGSVYASTPMVYGVSAYAYSMLETTTSSSFRTLLVDMLRYGAASQKYANHNVNNLVDAALTTEQASWGTSELRTLVNSASAPTFEEEEDIPAVAWVGMGLFLENKVAIRGYFDAPSTAGLYVQISDDEGNVLGRVTEEDFTTATGPAGTPVTGFLFDGLSVNQMSKVVNITVYNEIDQVVSGTYTYSIESYAYRNQNSSNTVLAELVKSMIKYGDAAKAYTA